MKLRLPVAVEVAARQDFFLVNQNVLERIVPSIMSSGRRMFPRSNFSATVVEAAFDPEYLWLNRPVHYN